MADEQALKDAGPDLIARVGEGKKKILAEFRKVIIGQEQIVDDVVTSFFAGGHCLITGVPGLAKTLLISSLGRAMTLNLGPRLAHVAVPRAARRGRPAPGLGPVRRDADLGRQLTPPRLPPRLPAVPDGPRRGRAGAGGARGSRTRGA
jgi:hypothetical protein